MKSLLRNWSNGLENFKADELSKGDSFRNAFSGDITSVYKLQLNQLNKRSIALMKYGVQDLYGHESSELTGTSEVDEKHRSTLVVVIKGLC